MNFWKAKYMRYNIYSILLLSSIYATKFAFQKMRPHIFFLLYLFLPAKGFSQLVITNNASALSLAHAIVGNGINVSNATLNCGNNSTATFTYSGANLGVPNGVLLTS